MTSCPLHFYLFKGNWSERFNELTEMLQPDNQQIFAIWEPKDKIRQYNLIVVYGMPLASSYCYENDIWKSDDKVFSGFYFPNKDRFTVHGCQRLAEQQVLINNVA